jgi:hypothetical protein
MTTPAREGMPELPAEVFVAITRGEGYEDVCDQLLAEDAFGPNNPFEWRVVDTAALSQPAQGGRSEVDDGLSGKAGLRRLTGVCFDALLAAELPAGRPPQRSIGRSHRWR